jgi:hypothetical protein
MDADGRNLAQLTNDKRDRKLAYSRGMSSSDVILVRDTGN